MDERKTDREKRERKETDTVCVCSGREKKRYWVTQKLTQIRTVILRICIGKVAGFAIYICGNFWVTQ